MMYSFECIYLFYEFYISTFRSLLASNIANLAQSPWNHKVSGSLPALANSAYEQHRDLCGKGADGGCGASPQTLKYNHLGLALVKRG